MDWHLDTRKDLILSNPDICFTIKEFDQDIRYCFAYQALVIESENFRVKFCPGEGVAHAYLVDMSNPKMDTWTISDTCKKPGILPIDGWDDNNCYVRYLQIFVEEIEKRCLSLGVEK